LTSKPYLKRNTSLLKSSMHLFGQNDRITPSNISNQTITYLNHRLSIDRPTIRLKEKSPSDGHCQCRKEMDDHLLACLQFLTESHIMTRLASERASFLNMNDINDLSFFETSDCYATEDTLSRWSRLHSKSFVPTPVSRRVDVRQAAGRRNNCRIFITT
jgi:hypothetical protein